MLRCCVITLIIRHPRLRTKLHVTPSHDTRHWEKLWICQNLCDHNEAGLHWTLDTGVKFDPHLLLVAGDSCLPLQQSSHHWRFCSTHFQTAIWCPKTDTAWHSTIKMRPPFVILCTKAFKFSLSCQLATISCQNRQWWRGTKQQPNTRSPLIRAPKVIHDPTLFNLKFPI